MSEKPENAESTAPKPLYVLGLTGAPGAGKGEVAAILREWGEKRGWRVGHLSFSDQIKEDLRAHGVPDEDVTRELLTRTATEMRAAEGPAVLAKRIIAKIRGLSQDAQCELHVVEAIRHVSEIEVLRDAFGEIFFLVAVTADLDAIVERMLARARPDESREAMQGADAARRVLQRELDGLKGPNAFNISQCLKRADFHIKNHGSLADLRRDVVDFVSRMG